MYYSWKIKFVTIINVYFETYKINNKKYRFKKWKYVYLKFIPTLKF